MLDQRYWLGFACLFNCQLLYAGSLVNSDDPDLAAGDILQLAIPFGALAYSWAINDEQGVQQWWKSTGTTLGATLVLKAGMNSTAWGERPNGGKGSFPSGHTASACSGAFFLADRYGWQFGGPALVAAGFVGYSRVDEGYHHWRDVAAGCLLAASISYYFVMPQAQKSVMIAPDWVDGNLGMTLIMNY